MIEETLTKYKKLAGIPKPPIPYLPDNISEVLREKGIPETQIELINRHPDEIYQIPVRYLGLKNWTLNRFRRYQQDDELTLGKLCATTERALLSRVPNFGEGCLADLKSKLAPLGLTIEMETGYKPMQE